MEAPALYNTYNLLVKEIKFLPFTSSKNENTIKMSASMASCRGRLKNKTKLFTMDVWKTVYPLEINSDIVLEEHTTI